MSHFLRSANDRGTGCHQMTPFSGSSWWGAALREDMRGGGRIHFSDWFVLG
jgi:hypothetical protein